MQFPLTITKQALPRVGRLGLNYPGRKVSAIRNKMPNPNIVEDVYNLLESLTGSALQDTITSIKNIQIFKLLKSNRNMKGPLNYPGTIGIKNRFILKCPTGSMKNKLGQCIKKTTL